MLDYDIARRGNLPRYEYLYRCIREDVLSGALAAGDRLPSKRTCAAQLGIALVTVENAYAQLEAEGYITARPRSGYYVNALPQLAGTTTTTHTAVPQRRLAGPRHEREAQGAAQDVAQGKTQQPLLADFSRPATRADSSAANLWERALRQTLTQESPEDLFAAQPAQGTERLRAAIASYLQRVRGVSFDPGNVVVGAGAQVVYTMISGLVGAGTPVAVEDPGYGRVWATYEACHLPVSFVPTDSEGLRANLLASTGARIAHVMPSHQFPTGRVTSVARRFELLSWAAADDRYIVEDDYDCEFRMAGRPVPPLLASDTAGRVLYVNTFSKSLSSALRLAYLVLPDELAHVWQERLGFLACTVSVVDQVALARLLESGDYERHVARYRTQQRRLLEELIGTLKASPSGDRLTFEEAESGLHFVLAVETPSNYTGSRLAHKGQSSSEDTLAYERELASWTLDHGIKLAPLSTYAHDPANAVRPDGKARFVMQYDGLDPTTIPQVASRLSDVIASHS